MREWPSLLGLILLVPAVLFGVVQASHTLEDLSVTGDAAGRADAGAIGDLPGVEVLASARQSDHEGAQYTLPKPGRSPFIPPVRKKRSIIKDRGAIPQIVTVLADSGRIAVVLKSEGISSGPVIAGETFREWKVIDVSWEMVLLSREGVNYSLPVPAD